MTTLTSISSPAPRSAWRQVLAADPYAVVSQSPEWLDVMISSQRWVDASRYYVTDDGRELVFTLARRRGAGEWGPQASFGEGWGMGGLLAPGGPTAEEVTLVITDLAALPSVSTAIRPNPLLAEVWSEGSADCEVVGVAKRAHVLDLSGGATVVWEDRFRQGARRDVRRAERMGVEVVRDTDGSLVPVFYELLLRSFDRWAERSHEPLWMAQVRGRWRDPLAKFEHMRHRLGASLRLYVAFYQRKPAATILVLVGANAHYTRGAMDIEVGGKANPNDLLHWVAIRDACEAGCGVYHMGDSGTSTTLSRFKEKFGARPIDYSGYRIERLPLTSVDRVLRTTVKRVVGFRDA